MIKVFTTNKNGKIELDKDELKKLLDEAYWEGYAANSHTYTYIGPSVYHPYYWTTTVCNTSNDTVLTLNSTNTTACINNNTSISSSDV